VPSVVSAFFKNPSSAINPGRQAHLGQFTSQEISDAEYP